MHDHDPQGPNRQWDIPPNDYHGGVNCLAGQSVTTDSARSSIPSCWVRRMVSKRERPFYGTHACREFGIRSGMIDYMHGMPVASDFISGRVACALCIALPSILHNNAEYGHGLAVHGYAGKLRNARRSERSSASASVDRSDRSMSHSRAFGKENSEHHFKQCNIPTPCLVPGDMNLVDTFGADSRCFVSRPKTQHNFALTSN